MGPVFRLLHCILLKKEQLLLLAIDWWRLIVVLLGILKLQIETVQLIKFIVVRKVQFFHLIDFTVRHRWTLLYKIQACCCLSKMLLLCFLLFSHLAWCLLWVSRCSGRCIVKLLGFVRWYFAQTRISMRSFDLGIYYGSSTCRSYIRIILLIFLYIWRFFSLIIFTARRHQASFF